MGKPSERNMRTNLEAGTRNAFNKYMKNDRKLVSGANKKISQAAQMGGAPPKHTYYQAYPSLPVKKSWRYFLKGANGHTP